MSHKPAHHQLTTHALDALHWIAAKLGVDVEGFADVNREHGIPTGDSLFKNADGIAFSVIHSEHLNNQYIQRNLTEMYPKQIAAHGVTKHYILVLCRHHKIPERRTGAFPRENTFFLLIHGHKVKEL